MRIHRRSHEVAHAVMLTTGQGPMMAFQAGGPHAQDLVDAFGFEPEHVRAPIASGGERERQDEARAYYADLEASGRAPISEKQLKRKHSSANAADGPGAGSH